MANQMELKSQAAAFNSDNSGVIPCKVGDPATIGGWSDRHGCTVIEVSANGRCIVVQQDNATRVDGNGASESQNYTFERNPNGCRYTFTLRKNGRYVQYGSKIGQGMRLSVGHRSEYYDYSY